MLVRRVRDACAAPDVQCIGTSATMSTEGSSADRRQKVAEVATQLFGTTVLPENVIGETLVRATDEHAGPVTVRAASRAPAAPADYADLVARPARLLGRDQLRAGPGRGRPAGAAGPDHGRSSRRPSSPGRPARTPASARRRCGGRCRPARRPGTRQTGRPLFAFRLHQFLSKGDTVYVTLEDEPSRHITRDYQVEQPGSDGKVAAAAGVLPRMRPGVPGGLAAAPRRRGPVHGPPGRQRVRRRRRRRLPLRLQRHAVAAGPGYRDRRAPAARLLAGGLRPHRAGRGRGRRPASTFRTRSTVDAAGRERPATGGIEAAFIPAPFLFCLRCGVTYEQVRGRDFAKLATFDQEGRSSATSLISTSIVRSPAGGAAGGPGPGGPQAADVRRQPAGRLAAGRSLQRLRPGHPAARRAVPGRATRRAAARTA